MVILTAHSCVLWKSCLLAGWLPAPVGPHINFDLASMSLDYCLQKCSDRAKITETSIIAQSIPFILFSTKALETRSIS